MLGLSIAALGGPTAGAGFHHTDIRLAIHSGHTDTAESRGGNIAYKVDASATWINCDIVNLADITHKGNAQGFSSAFIQWSDDHQIPSNT